MISGFLEPALGPANAFHATVAVLAVVAAICMLVAAFGIDEVKYADTQPSSTPMGQSVVKTFKNREFQIFEGSDVLYWVSITMFQTGLPYYVTELMGFDDSWVFIFFAAMTAISLLFYVPVNILAKKMGKKKLVAFAVIILGNDRLDSATIGKLPNLKLVVRHGAGLDNIDFSELGKRDITVANTPGANKEETADLTFALILDLARMVTQSINQLKGGVWNKIPGRTRYGKTIGIIGVGAIGMAVASRAMGFRMDILGNDIVQRDEAARFGLLYTSLNELLSASDVVTIHVSLTSATKNLIGARELKRMKLGTLLINTARAGVVREAALEKALMSGHLGGYAVDVYAKEPPDPTSYMSLPNVLTTPHIGSSTMEANLRMGDMAVDNILAFMNGAVLPNKVTVVDRLRFS